MAGSDRRSAKLTLNRFSSGYLLLSFLSGFLELGIIIYAVRQEMTILSIPLLGIAYQAGALFRKPIELTWWQYMTATVLGLVLLTICGSMTILVLAVFFLSLGLQGSRELALRKAEVSTFGKRMSRVAGFAVSGFLSQLSLIGIAVIVLATTLMLAKDLTGVKAPIVHRNWHAGVLGVTMLAHQSHYFSYAYLIPFLFWQVHNMSAPFVGLAFCIGWISYSIAPYLHSRRHLTGSFASGHILASLTLITISVFFQNLWVVMLAWFVSGFGGGTVFCLRELESNLADRKPDLDLWENLGHIVGLAICLTLLAVFEQPTIVFLAGGVIAILTGLLLLLARQRGSARFPRLGGG